MNIKCEDTLQALFFSSKELNNFEWEQLCESINNTIVALTQKYIWHRDDFKVVYPISPGITTDVPCHLMSITCFGDNIEDEWFIVYLIFEITNIYNDVIVQIEDNDGAFLLIEAADYLPNWVKPETSENRVFIYKHHLHIIPPSLVSADVTLNLQDALNLVVQNSEETKASREIEDAIVKRISEYPQKSEESYHKAILKLPPEIATILTLKPSLISPIVNTFCNLDLLDSKHCKDIKCDNFIKAEVTFTKFLYAMLIHTKLPNYNKLIISKYDKKSQLGLKLVYGYRIIMSKLCNDIFLSPQYKKFIENLTKNGYFKDNIPDSREYTNLLDKAKHYFINMECSINAHVCNTINDLKSSEAYDSTRNILQQKSDQDCLEEDDDNWLNVEPEQLNDYLNKHYGKNLKLKNNDPVTSHIITSELSHFLKETSDFDGIEENKKEKERNVIDFDSDKFVDCLEKMLSLVSDQNNFDLNDSDFSSDNEDDSAEIIYNATDLAQDLELVSKLKTEKGNGDASILKNLSQSMKEEGIIGPASSVLRNIGVNKSDVLDSDDDEY